jgi:Phage baseplate assembly protein W
MIGVNAATGKYLNGNEHLRQSIEDILTTPVGSRVLLRDYGSLLFSLVDNPQDDSARVRIIQAAATAIIQWEPRITLRKVVVSFVEEGRILADRGRR